MLQLNDSTAEFALILTHSLWSNGKSNFYSRKLTVLLVIIIPVDVDVNLDGVQVKIYRERLSDTLEQAIK